jgi:hypothetical protein
MKLVGRIEKIEFSDLNICLEAKVDTGAWRTSIHVDGVELIDNKLKFWIGDKSNYFIFKDFRVIKVKSSFGKIQKRFSIKTNIVLGGRSYKILVSLSNRKNMKFSCLLGRRFLSKNKFLVDVNKKYLNDTNQKM